MEKMEEYEKNEYANLILNAIAEKKNNVSYEEIEEIFEYTIHCLKRKLTLQNLF